MSVRGWEAVDVSTLARNQDTEQLMRLLQMVVCVAVQCPHKEKYIERIRQLPEECQQELMVFIQRILNKSRDSYNPASSELDKLRLLNQELTREVENLNLELAETRKEHDLFVIRVGKMTGSEIEDSALTLELETQIAKLAETNKELERQLTEQRKSHILEISELRDELDISNERILQLGKLEGTLEKLQQKSEELVANKKKTAELQSYCDSLCEQIRVMKETTPLIDTLAVYKEQLTQEKSVSVTLNMRIEGLEEELREVNRSRQEAVERCKVVEARAQYFAEQLTKSTVEDVENPLAEDIPLQAQVPLTQQTLEEIRRHFDEQLNSLTREKLLLEEKLKKCMEELEAIRKNPVIVRVEDQEMKALLLAKDENLLVLQRDKAELVAKNEKLAAEVEKTAKFVEENERLKAEKEQLMQENAKVYREKDEISHKYLEQKDSVIQLSSQISQKDKEITQFRTENDALKSQISELITVKTVQSEESSGKSEEKQGHLKVLEYENEAMKVQMENANLRLKLRDAVDEIKAQSGVIEGLMEENGRIRSEMQKAEDAQVELVALQKTRSQEETRHKQTLSNLEVQVGSHQEQIRSLEMREKDLRRHFNLEEKLMSVALHELGMEVFRRSAERNGAIPSRSTNKAP